MPAHIRLYLHSLPFPPSASSSSFSFPPAQSAEEPFLYQMQRRHAQRAWLVPLNEFVDVIETKLEVRHERGRKREWEKERGREGEFGM